MPGHLSIDSFIRMASVIHKPIFYRLLLSTGLCCLYFSMAAAQSIPNAADVGRLKPEQPLRPLPASPAEQLSLPSVTPFNAPPPNAEKIEFTLNHITLKGNTQFSDRELSSLYSGYVGEKTSLSTVYHIASAITKYYRDKGYFLSLAYVPEQKIAGGNITINVIEGYIADITLKGKAESSSMVRDYAQRLKDEKPLRIQTLESILLRLNDLPGYSFDGVLTPCEKKGEGAVGLVLTSRPKGGQGTLRFDNYSSRYLGPHEAVASYSASILPMQQTTLSGGNSVPLNKLHYVALNHAIVVAPDLTLDVGGNYITAEPGYRLKPFDIESDTTFLSASLRYQWLRQREENLSISLGIDGRNSNTDALGAALTKDRIRALRASANYDMQDAWNGYSVVQATVSQGVKGLGATDAGKPTISRAEAVPDFTKMELSLSRLQTLDQDWSLLMSASGQIASDPLYSSEEFGYGGQTFGRAYDSSELGGDHGLAGALELRYAGWTLPEMAVLSPYAFYDIGRVWNMDTAQIAMETASSIGVGLRATTSFKMNADVGIAFPLIRNEDAPIYGASERSPRLLLELSQDF